jgi:hypothetical protein
MNSLKSIIAALVAGTTLAVSMPVMANPSGDTGVVQGNTQTNYVDGNGNIVNNRNSQKNTDVRNGRGSRGDSATIQTNDQLNDVRGNNNRVGNTNSQTSTTVRNNGRTRISQ